MTLEERIKAAMLKVVQRRDPEACEIVSYDEQYYEGGTEYTPECDYEVSINYRRRPGQLGHVYYYAYPSKFTDLIREMSKVEQES